MKAVTKITILIVALVAMSFAGVKAQGAIKPRTVTLINGLSCTLSFTNSQGENYLLAPGQTMTADETTDYWTISDEQERVIVDPYGGNVYGTLNDQPVEAIYINPITLVVMPLQE